MPEPQEASRPESVCPSKLIVVLNGNSEITSEPSSPPTSQKVPFESAQVFPPSHSPHSSISDEPSQTPAQSITASPLQTPAQAITAAPLQTPAQSITASPLHSPEQSSIDSPKHTPVQSPSGPTTKSQSHHHSEIVS